MIDPSQYSRVHEMERLNPTDALIAWDDTTNSLGHIKGEKFIDSPITEVTGTTYTILSTDRVIRTMSDSATTITVPILPEGRGVAVIQVGDGQITYSAGSGVTIVNVDSETKSAGTAGAVCGLFVVQNEDDTSATVILSGATGV